MSTTMATPTQPSAPTHATPRPPAAVSTPTGGDDGQQPDVTDPGSSQPRAALVRKVVGAISVVALAWSALAVSNIMAVRGLADEIHEVEQRNVLGLEEAADLSHAVDELGIDVRAHILAPSDDLRAEALALFDESAAHFDDTIAEYEQLVEGDEVRAPIAASVRGHVEEATAAIRADVFPLSADDASAAFAAFQEDGARVALAEATASLTELRTLEGEEAELAAQAAADHAAAASLRTAVIAGLLVVACLGGGYWFARRTEDEINEMSDQLAASLGSIEAVMVEVAENAISLAGAAEELSSVSTTLERDAATTDGEAVTAASAAKEAADAVTAAAAAAEQLTTAIGEISQHTTSAARHSSDALSAAEVASSTMTTLREATDDITAVVDMIASIAEQTNLLALNATIEAARAGEMGQGFAVVAGEVKTLANDSSSAAQDVAEKIAAMEGSARDAITALDEVAGVIEQINAGSHTIAAAVEEQNAATNEIARSLSGASASTESIGVAVDGVSEAASSTRRSASDASMASGELTRMAAALQGLVGRFSSD